ncbi:MAG: GNAT family protein [Actinomycetes bacterium]
MAISLRPFTRADFTRLIEWVDGAGPEFLVQWAGTKFAFPLDEAQLEGYLEEAEGPEATRFIFAAVDDDSGDVVGHVELSRLDRRNMSASVSRLLVGDKAARGQGTGAQIVSLLLDKAFRELDLHRVDLYVIDINLAAIRLYEGLGFKTEGHFVEARRAGGKYWNVYYMAMLKEQWLGRNAG